MYTLDKALTYKWQQAKPTSLSPCRQVTHDERETCTKHCICFDQSRLLYKCCSAILFEENLLIVLKKLHCYFGDYKLIQTWLPYVSFSPTKIAVLKFLICIISRGLHHRWITDNSDKFKNEDCNFRFPVFWFVVFIN